MSNDPVLSYAGESPLSALGELFRDGPFLIARDNIELPRRCVLCNDIASETANPVTLTFTWDSSFTMTKTSTLQMRREGKVRAFLCNNHQRRWQTGRLLGTIAIVASTLAMAIGASITIASELSDIPRHSAAGITALLIGFACLIISLFTFTLRTRTVSCEKIENGYLHLRGVDHQFLAALPQLPPAIP